MFTRRRVLAGATALGGGALLPGIAQAKGSVTAAIYPGTWEDAYRAIVTPALKKTYDVDLELQPLFAVDEVATSIGSVTGAGSQPGPMSAPTTASSRMPSTVEASTPYPRRTLLGSPVSGSTGRLTRSRAPTPRTVG